MKERLSRAKQNSRKKRRTTSLVLPQQGKKFHMAQSLDSRDEEVVVKIDRENDCGKGTGTASKLRTATSSSKLPGSSVKAKVSFEEVLSEAVRRTSKDSSSGGAELWERSSKYYTRRNSWRLLMDKTKSRLIDPPEEHYDSVFGKENGEEEDEIEDIPEDYKSMKFNILTILQLVSLVSITAALVCSLSVPVIKQQKLWDLPLWKWEILILALICGRLGSGLLIRIVVFLIERNFLWRKRVLYFVYGLRRAVQNCLWLGLVLLVWHFIFDNQVEKEIKSKVSLYVSRILVCFLAATLMWLLKTLIVKILASSFHVNTFFERIQEALFNQYVIEILSGPPLFERNSEEEEVQKFPNTGANMPGDLREALLQKRGSEKKPKYSTIGKKPRYFRTISEKQEIPLDHLHKLNQKNISAWNMKRMINIIRHRALSTLDEHILNSDMEDESLMQIRTECQAKEAARKIFNNVAKPGFQYVILVVFQKLI